MRGFGVFLAVMAVLVLLLLGAGWILADVSDVASVQGVPKAETSDIALAMPQTSLSEILRADSSTSPKATPKPKTTGSSSHAKPTPKAPSVPAPEPETVTSSPPPDPRFANRELARQVIELVPPSIRFTFITASHMTGAVVVQDAPTEELDQYSIPAEDFLAMTEDEREKALKDLLWRYWDDHPEKAPKPIGREDYAFPHTKDVLIPLRLWFPEWWFAHYDVDPCNDVVYWREVPACREVVKEQPTQSWLLNR